MQEPRSNKHGRISPCRIRRHTAICGEKNGRLLSWYTEAVYNLRFPLYTIVLLRMRSRRYTIVIRSHVLRQNTVVYGRIVNVYGRLRPYTDLVTVDLGIATYSLFYLKKRVIYILDSGGYTWINSNSRNRYSFKTAFVVLIGKVYFYFFSLIDFLYL